MEKQITPLLFVTVYDASNAQLGGAAWVDTKVRTEPPLSGAECDEFLVTDKTVAHPVELEIREDRWTQIRTLFRMLAFGEPYICAKFRQSRGWRERQRALKQQAQARTIITSQWPALLLAADAGVPVQVHIAHNVDFKLSELHDPPLFRFLRNARRTRSMEIRTLSIATHVVALSTFDQALLEASGVPSCHLSLAPATLPGTASPKNSTVGFIGKASWPPNEVALQALQKEVMPVVRAAMGADSPRLLLAGKGTEAFGDAYTTALGPVESVSDFYSSIDLVVVPRGAESSGVSVKVLEAWEHGVSVIAPAGLLQAIGVEESQMWDSDSDSIARAIVHFYSDAQPPQRTMQVKAGSLSVSQLGSLFRDLEEE